MPPKGTSRFLIGIDRVIAVVELIKIACFRPRTGRCKTACRWTLVASKLCVGNGGGLTILTRHGDSGDGFIKAASIYFVCIVYAILRVRDRLTNADRDLYGLRRVGVRDHQCKACRLRGVFRIGGGDGHLASLQSRHPNGAAAHAAVCVGRVGGLNLNDALRGSRPVGAGAVINAQRQILADFQRGRAAALAADDLEFGRCGAGLRFRKRGTECRDGVSRLADNAGFGLSTGVI